MKPSKHRKIEIIYCECGCGKTLNKYDIYNRTRKFLSGHNGRKYKDPYEYKRQWNKRNPNAYSKARREGRWRRKGELIKFLGGKCYYCNEIYDGKNACIFDFHHLNPENKKFGIGGNMYERSFKYLVEEAKKCVVCCSNCHRKQHSGLY